MRAFIPVLQTYHDVDLTFSLVSLQNKKQNRNAIADETEMVAVPDSRAAHHYNTTAECDTSHTSAIPVCAQCGEIRPSLITPYTIITLDFLQHLYLIALT